MMREPRLTCEKKKTEDGEVFDCQIENVDDAIIRLPEFSDFILLGKEGRCLQMHEDYTISECKDVYDGIIAFNYGLYNEIVKKFEKEMAGE